MPTFTVVLQLKVVVGRWGISIYSVVRYSSSSHFVAPNVRRKRCVRITARSRRFTAAEINLLSTSAEVPAISSCHWLSFVVVFGLVFGVVVVGDGGGGGGRRFFVGPVDIRSLTRAGRWCGLLGRPSRSCPCGAAGFTFPFVRPC